MAGYERLDAMQAKLAAFKKSGAISSDDYTLFSGKIAQMRAEVDKAGKSTHTLTLNSALARRELGRLGTDVASGNWGRFSQTSMTLANYTGVMGLAFSAAGAAVAGIVAPLALFAAAAIKAYNEQQALNKAVEMTGGYAGQTTGTIAQLAGGMAVFGESTGKAREAMIALAGTGKVGSDSFKAMGQAAVNMAALTGESADKASASVV